MIATTGSAARSLCRTRLEMVEACGRISQFAGLPRSLGQIYGLICLSPRPLSLDDIAGLLGISKASASTGTRQLAAWGGIRPVWIHGERREFFEAEPELNHLLRSSFTDVLKPKLLSSQKRLERLAATLEDEFTRGVLSRAEYKLCAGRLKQLTQFQKKLERLAPLAESLF